MTNTKKAFLIVLLTGYPLYGDSAALAPVVPVYDQPASRMGSEPVPRNTDPYLVPANRNPYFDDPSMRSEGVPTGNPEMTSGASNHLEGNNAGGPNERSQDHTSGTSGTSGQ